MTTSPDNLQPAIQRVYADHRRIVKEKNRQINALQAEKGELQRALQERQAAKDGNYYWIDVAKTQRERAWKSEDERDRFRAEVVKAKMQAQTAYDDAIYAQELTARTVHEMSDAQNELRPPANNLVEQMKAAYESADNDMAPIDGDTLIVWKGKDWWEVGVALPGRPLGNRLARVLHRPAPARPEGAEEIEAVLNRYWSGDINGADLADRIAEEMNR